MDPAAFITKIWHLQGKSTEESTGFVARKDWETGDWKEVATQAAADIPNMDQDWYFAPCLFTGKRRLREAARPSRVLYADLDEVDPRSIEDVPPTLGWETSPGRFQGLWIVDRAMKLEQFENLNRRLTYHVKADRGGWSSTKVLRIPGTVSTKYGKSRARRFRVHIICKGDRYTVQDLHGLLVRDPDLGGASSGTNTHEWGNLPDVDQVLRQWRKKLPTKAKTLLRADSNTVGKEDRSTTLYLLEGLLLDAGLTPEETLVVVRDSAWNKYRGQRRELPQLKREIRKQVEEHKVRDVERMVGRVRARAKTNGHDKKLALKLASRNEIDGLPRLTYQEFLHAHFPEPQWLVEGFWGLGAYGVWAGEFKSFKTVTLLDFALSVASGQPFLNRFKVHKKGRVMYAFDEGQPGYIQERLRRIAWQKGVGGGQNGDKFVVQFPDNLPLDMVANPGLDFMSDESRERLATYCSKFRPLVIILESFYLMAREIDENSAKDVTAALSFLKELAHEYGTGIVISHHYNKEASSEDGKKRRSGLRMSGSSVFGRWYESAVYLERQGEDEDGRALITAEHREQKGSGRLHMQISMDTEDETDYNVEIEEANVRLNAAEEAKDKKRVEDIVRGKRQKRPMNPGDLPCPVCKVPEGTQCKDPQGDKRAYHPSRKKALSEAQVGGV